MGRGSERQLADLRQELDGRRRVPGGLRHKGDELHIEHFEAPALSESGDVDDRLDVLSLDFLIRTYVLSETAPHSVFDCLESAKGKLIAHISLKRYGCDARFACLTRDLWTARVGS
jgi:hypothetical protein